MIPRVIAHRCNSLAAIESAAANGADGVELDVRAGPTLAHDEGAAGPSLDDALVLAAGLGLAVQLDVKEPGLAPAIEEAVGRRGLAGRTFVSSPSAEILAPFSLPRALTYPEDRRGATERRLTRPLVPLALAVLRAALPYRLPRMLRAAGATIATLNDGVVGARTLKTCRDEGVSVAVWTVDDETRARTLVAAGTAAIITDDPRILLGGITDT
jgi:glycerophosphoryl diester phosphodiesterase